MKSINSKLLAATLVGLFSSYSPLSAALIIIGDGVLSNGNASTSSGGGSADGFSSAQPYNGFDSYKYTTSVGGGKFAGVDFYSGSKSLGINDTHLIVTLYTPSSSATAMNGFKFSVKNTTSGLESETNLSNANNSFWKLDGVAGDIANFTPDTWHTIVVDLSANPNFEAGNSTTKGQWGWKSQDTVTKTLYIGDMRVTAIPEPSSLALLGFGALGLLARRRR